MKKKKPYLQPIESGSFTEGMKKFDKGYPKIEKKKILKPFDKMLRDSSSIERKKLIDSITPGLDSSTDFMKRLKRNKKILDKTLRRKLK